jgi:hypothetical protein
VRERVVDILLSHFVEYMVCSVVLGVKKSSDAIVDKERVDALRSTARKFVEKQKDKLSQ